MKEIKYIVSHQCNEIKDSSIVSVEKCLVSGEVNWYYRMVGGNGENDRLSLINYCPHCGKELD